jgi:hypothetical protein
MTCARNRMALAVETVAQTGWNAICARKHGIRAASLA